MKQDLHLNKILHRFLGVWIAAIMLLAAGSAAAQTLDATFTVDSIHYKVTKVSPAEVTITGNSLITPTALDISTVTYNHVTYSVTTIGNNAFAGCDKLTSATFRNVVSIGGLSFTSCSKLANVDFPKATSIGGNAFAGPSLLTSVTFPMVTTLGPGVFNSNPIDSVTMNAIVTVPETAFAGNHSLKYISLKSAETIQSQAFAACNSLTTLILPNAKTFDVLIIVGCTSLKSLSLQNATSIQSSTFSGSRLESLTMDAIVTIPASAFSGISTLSYLSLPNATTLDIAVFEGCTSLKSLTLPKVTNLSVKSNGNSFSGSSLDSLTMNAIQTIPDGLFSSYFKTLKYVNMPQVTTVGGSAFLGCDSLLTVLMPKVESIGSNAFQGCIALKSVNFPELTTMATNGFYTCTSLTNVVMPKLKVIDELTFYACISLKTVSIPEATIIKATAFQECKSLTSVTFPKVTELEHTAFYLDQGLKSAVFPKLETIGEATFAECKNLSSLSLGATPPSTVGENAFMNCPETRKLNIIAEDGSALSSAAATTATTAYKAVNDGATDDNYWYGWTLSAGSIVMNISGIPSKILIGTTFLNDTVKVVPSTFTSDQIIWDVLDAGTTKATINMQDTTVTATSIGDMVLRAVVKNNNDTIFTKAFPISVVDTFTVDSIIYRITAFTPAKTVSAIDHIYKSAKALDISTVTFAGLTYTVTGIEQNAFSERKKETCLTSVRFPEVISIGEDAFLVCENLATADFPKATVIGEKAFNYCLSLTSATLPNVTSVGSNSFFQCWNLTSLSLPKVTTFGNNVFGACEKLASLSLGATPPVGDIDFWDGPSPRNLTLVASNGTPLSGAVLNAAIKNYKNDTGYDDATNTWFGWTLQKLTDLADATITLSSSNFQANGSQIQPNVAVFFDGKALTEGTDFTITYQHNVEPGTASVTIIGMGAYSGSQTVTFTITAKPVYVIIPKVDGVSVTPGFGLNLAGLGQPFEFTVTPDASLGKEGTDYTLEVRTDKGETLTPNGTSYKIATVDHETTVYIIVKKLTTGVEAIKALTVYGGQGSITILSPNNTTALVVNLTGKVIASTKIASGKTTFSGLSKGIYIVKVGTETTKVVVK